jgi:hypothetical protein
LADIGDLASRRLALCHLVETSTQIIEHRHQVLAAAAALLEIATDVRM